MQLKDISTKEVLQLQNKWSENNHEDITTENPFVYEILAKKYGVDEKLIFSKMEKLEDEGYLEYGVSLRTAWLTEKGKLELTIDYN